MQQRPGIEERLSLSWREDELTGALPRRGSTDAIESFVETMLGLMVVFVAGVAVPAAMTSLMLSAGLSGWPFPALVGALFFAGVGALGLNLLLRIVDHGLQSVNGVTPWRFVLTPTHLTWSGSDSVNAWVPGAFAFRPTLPFGARRVALPLQDIEAIDAAPPGLQIELVSGGTVFLDVDPTTMAPGDLEALCGFVRERVNVARDWAKGRDATTAEARAALHLARAQWASSETSASHRS